MAEPGKRGDDSPARRDSDLELSFPSASEYLTLIRRVVDWFSEHCGFEEKDRGRIVLAVEEATTNVIRHSYGGDPGGKITIRLRGLGECIEVEILDDGTPATAKDLERARSGKLEPGGLGVRMMRTCMDEFRYEARPEGGARQILRKRRRPEEKAP